MDFVERSISITFMSGPDDGKTAFFEQPEMGDELVLSIGRREGCDLFLPYDHQASRLHARLGCVVSLVTASDTSQEPYVLGFWLEDAHSRNGTYVEKDPHPIRRRVSLRPGTLFRVGRTWLRLDVPMSI
jgi:pSer/pThr/pTyr-binding forkhead associated (FHA) protein